MFIRAMPHLEGLNPESDVPRQNWPMHFVLGERKYQVIQILFTNMALWLIVHSILKYFLPIPTFSFI